MSGLERRQDNRWQRPLPVRVPSPAASSGMIVMFPTENDVLSGRGVNISSHRGNERFRALINTRYDPSYCAAYKTEEKRAVALDIIAHLRTLSPPGRFLKRKKTTNRSPRGLEGPWEELTKDEAIKRTLQALRDCSRPDRKGYAADVAIPEDVKQSLEMRSRMGLTNKQSAEQAAAKAKEREQLIESDTAPHDLAVAISTSGSMSPLADQATSAAATAAAAAAAAEFDEWDTENRRPRVSPAFGMLTEQHSDCDDIDNEIPLLHHAMDPLLENYGGLRNQLEGDALANATELHGASADFVALSLEGHHDFQPSSLDNEHADLGNEHDDEHSFGNPNYNDNPFAWGLTD